MLTDLRRSGLTSVSLDESAKRSAQDDDFAVSWTSLPFVIPSEAEGSAVLQTLPGNVFRCSLIPGECAGLVPDRHRGRL
jgi:hypothetical protein